MRTWREQWDEARAKGPAALAELRALVAARRAGAVARRVEEDRAAAAQGFNECEVCGVEIPSRRRRLCPVHANR